MLGCFIEFLGMVFKETIYDVNDTFEDKRNQVAGECSATWHPSQAVFFAANPDSGYVQVRAIAQSGRARALMTRLCEGRIQANRAESAGARICAAVGPTRFSARELTLGYLEQCT